MMNRRVLLPFVLFLLSGMFLLAGTAAAQVTGPCQATIAGVDVNSAATPQTAVEVDRDQSIAIEVTGPEKFTGHKVMLEFAGIQWTVNEQTDDGKSWTNTVDVATYAKYGVGLYKVIGVSTGNVCTGTAYVNIKGSPLGTAAGAAAAGMTIVGAGLVAASAVSAASRPRKRVQQQLAELQLQQAPPSGAPGEPQEITGYEFFLKATKKLESDLGDPKTCPGKVPVAMLQTMAFMVSGTGAPGAPGAVVSKPRIGFKPPISATGVIGAFLAGLGTLVLAQQFGIVYPTRTVTIVWLVAAIVIDVLLTTVARRAGVKKAFALIEAAVARASAAAPEAQA